MYQQSALAETFVDGKEYNLALYASSRGVVTLPPGEIVFAPGLRREQRVVGWKAKWDLGSVEDLSTESRIVIDMDAALHAEITATCRHVAAMMGMAGYCRFDLRQGPDGRIQIIDINANPDIGPGSGFRKALAAANIRFEDFLAELDAREGIGARLVDGWDVRTEGGEVLPPGVDCDSEGLHASMVVLSPDGVQQFRGILDRSCADGGFFRTWPLTRPPTTGFRAAPSMTSTGPWSSCCPRTGGCRTPSWRDGWASRSRRAPDG